MIHPSVRNFSWQTTCEVTAWSRSKFWRYGIKIPTVGRDILDFIRGRRALDELPPLSEIEEAHSSPRWRPWKARISPKLPRRKLRTPRAILIAK